MEELLDVYPLDDPGTVLYRLSKKIGVPAWRLKLEERFVEVAVKEERTIRYRDMTEFYRDHKEDITHYLRYHEEEAMDKEEADKIALEKREEKEAKKRAQVVERLFKETEIATTNWKIETHLMKYSVEDERSLGMIFDEMGLPTECLLAVFHREYFWWGQHSATFCKLRKPIDRRLLDVGVEVVSPGIYLYRADGLSPMILKKDEASSRVELEIEEREGDRDLSHKVLEALGMQNGLKSTKDIGMMGHFFFRGMFIEIPLFQDACMNDPVISTFFYVNELRRASFENNLPLAFRPFLVDYFGLAENAQRTEDVTLRNLHRQTGFQVQVSLNVPISSGKIGAFFYLMSRLMGRFQSKRETWLEEYTRFLPDLSSQFEKRRKELVKNKKEDRPEYFDKYPRMFVTSYYSVVCQQKKQPMLLTQEDVEALPEDQRHRVFRFPRETIAEEFHPEYYYCPNDAFPHPGLKKMDLKGGDIHINVAPCCFGSPQGEKTEDLIRNIRTKDAEDDEEDTKRRKKPTKDTNNIITGKFLIKQPDQMGTIRPPSMRRFLLALDPFMSYYRIGVEASPSSLLACLITMRRMQGTNPIRTDVVTLRRRMARHADCAEACMQSNPGMDVERIRKDMEDPAVYFDPRRFYRAVELFFTIRLVIFTKPPEMLLEDADLLFPDSMRSYYSATVSQSLPVVIVFEHWGGKTNILAKLPYPHCELIVHKSPTEAEMKAHVEPGPVFQVLSNLRFQFDGKTPIYPLMNRTWFASAIVGQTVDNYGKTHVLHFRHAGNIIPVVVKPPMPILDDIPILAVDFVPMELKTILPFLQRFEEWTEILLPPGDTTTAYFTVRQSNVFWKNSEEQTSVHFTFMVNVPQRPDPESSPILRIGQPNPLFVLDDSSSTKIVRTEKIARCLYDLAVYLFSVFLRRHKIRPDSTDADTILDLFRRDHIIIDPSHTYPYPIDPESSRGFLRSEDMLRMPSDLFWRRVRYNLKWMLFHRSEMLKTKAMFPSFYQKITDFRPSAQYYYCDLDRLHSVCRHAIDRRYEIETKALEFVGDEIMFWYHPTQSPVPHPCLVYTFASHALCLAAIVYHQRLGMVPTTEDIRGTTATFEDIVGDASIYQWKTTSWHLVHGEGDVDQPRYFIHQKEGEEKTRLLL